MARPSIFPLKKTLGSLFRARLLLLMAASAVLGIVFVFAAVSSLTWLWARFTHFSIPYADTLSTVLMGGLFSVAGWFMLPALVVFIVGIFQDIIVYRVEKAYYPEHIKPASNRFWPDLIHDIRFTIQALTLNILIIPFYLLAVGPFLSLILNSYLLGREFFETAASYHMSKTEARNLGRRNKGAVYLGGFLITILTLIPFINVFAPVFALAYMIHVFHAIFYKTADQS
jgi:CysZ protein